MQVANCLYLVRKWEIDEKTMRRQLKFFDEIGHVFQVINRRFSKEILEICSEVPGKFRGDLRKILINFEKILGKE